MDELTKSIESACSAFIEENGPIADGDSFVAEFNNCCLYVRMDGNHFVTEFVGGKPYRIDMTLSIYE